MSPTRRVAAAAEERLAHRRQAPAATGSSRASAAGSRAAPSSRRRAAGGARLVALLREIPGLERVEAAVHAVGELHDLAQRLAEFARLRTAPGSLPRCRARASASKRALSLRRQTPPSNCLWMNPAARLAMLTYLPTRSLLTRATKSSGLNSTSSTCPFELGGDVVAQPLGVHADLEVAQRREAGAAALAHLLAARR